MLDDDRQEIRKPAVAGSFYPGSAGDLTKTLAQLFAEVEKKPLTGRVMALIAPHAGYPYSGKTAARAYKLLEGEQFDTVVVISPSHTVFFKGSSVYDGDGYETPLGVVEIDKELSEKISSINPSVYLSKMGHATGTMRGEHALEVQLPFLQLVLGKFKLVAIVMGDQEDDSIRSLGETLTSALKKTNTLLVASTDLSHFHSEKKARRLDDAVSDAVNKFDANLLIETLETGKGEACGGGPMAAVMTATKRLGGQSAEIIDYSNSGQTTGDFDEVVGYLAAAIVGDKKAKTTRAPREVIGTMTKKEPERQAYDEQQREMLHRIARDSIKAKLEGREYSPPKEKWLADKRGAFVTLNIGGELQGCIGQVRGFKPLGETIAEMAQAAAFDDPRFTPLQPEQFFKVDIEISVLLPLVRVYDFTQIEIGRDGLMIKLDMHSGLLLPQVATEYGWDTITFLQQVCLKAGLPRSAYKEERAEIYRFSAEVF